MERGTILVVDDEPNIADLVELYLRRDGYRVVKAGNTFAAAVLASDPHEAGGRRVIFVSGDDADAKAEVIALFQDAGFFTFDLGSLSRGGEVQQFHGPLAGLNLVRLP